MKLQELFPEISLNPSSAKDIKQWILHLAVEGKLTKKWKEENSRSIKDWKHKTLGELILLTMGQAPPGTECNLNGIGTPFVKVGQFGVFRPEINEWTTKPLKLVDENYVLICVVGATIGKINLGIDCAIGRSVAGLKPKKELNQFYLYYFLKRWSTRFLESARGSAQGVINKDQLNSVEINLPPLEEQQAIVTIVEELFKEVDALAQQATERIALKRSYAQAALQRLCEADTKAEWQQIVSVFPEIFNDKQTIKTLRETILQLAVQGKLTAKWRSKEGDHQTAHELLAQIKAEKAQLIKDKKIKAEKPLPAIEADEVPFELPEGWVWCRLGEVTDIQRGSSPRPKGDPLYFSNIRTNYHWISIKDISKNSINNVLQDTEEFLTVEGTKYSRHIKNGEIIVAVSGSTTGKSCISGIDGYIYDGLAVLKQINHGINHFFLALYMNQMYNQMNNSKFGAAFPNINTNLLNEMKMALPSLAEQQIIVEKVNALMGLCDELEKEVEGRENILQTI